MQRYIWKVRKIIINMSNFEAFEEEFESEDDELEEDFYDSSDEWVPKHK